MLSCIAKFIFTFNDKLQNISDQRFRLPVFPLKGNNNNL